jgi:ABC-type lipoprotein release transport system permease subunit
VIVLCTVSLGASLLATTWPAQQASRIPPAVALRVED